MILGAVRAWSKAKIVLWISYEIIVMYFTNSERNRVIYELWEKNLTIGEISSSTNIPRSTVGYYVRKFKNIGTDEGWRLGRILLSLERFQTSEGARFPHGEIWG
jgi:hypothetical protein